MNTNETEDITLAEYLTLLRKHKWRIVSFIFACTILCAVTGLVLPAQYTAKIVLMPVTHHSTYNPMGSLASVASKFSGLASLAGLSINQDSEAAETLAILQSNYLTERYISKNNLLPILYPHLWDPRTKTWSIQNSKEFPTLWKASRLFKKKLRTVENTGKGGIVTMTITWTNPRYAAAWANGMVAMTNHYMRSKAISKAERDIAYLNSQAAKTHILSIQQAIYNLIETQIYKEMLAKGSQEYSLNVLDPAQPPQVRSSFTPLKWTFIGFFGSVAASLGLLFFQLAWKRSS